jgi:hypothetical protein
MHAITSLAATSIRSAHQFIIADTSRLSAMLLRRPHSFGADHLQMVSSSANQQERDVTSLTTSYKLCEQAMANAWSHGEPSQYMAALAVVLNKSAVMASADSLLILICILS